MHNDILEDIGLSSEEATVYTTLLKHGYLNARRIVQLTGIKRGMAYKALDQLEMHGLIEKKKEHGSVTVFFPIHPHALSDMLDTKAKQLETVRLGLDTVIGELASDFNLISGKPNIRFFEGKKGLENVVEDSLYAKEDIYTYLDLETVEKHMHDYNEAYTKKRDKLGIKKKGLILDSPFSRKMIKDYHTETTEAKFITHNAPPFETVMQIYDNKVTYITLDENAMIGVIIEDHHIYTMHRYLFEYLWSITPFPDEKTF